MRIKRAVKGLAVFILFACAFCYLGYSFLNPSPLFKCESGVYSFYLYSQSSNAQIVTVNAVEAGERAKGLQNIKGEGVFFDYQTNDRVYCLNIINNEIKGKKARLVFCETGDWGESYYYYTERISNFCIVNGERVNLHVVIGENSASIGSPLIFGSF